MMVIWLNHQLRNFWWWVRDVDLSTYTLRCGRCGGGAAGQGPVDGTRGRESTHSA
jgi:hypothetical protein